MTAIPTPPADLQASPLLRPPGRVLFIGSSFYNTWYLSRELRKMGWRADTFTCAGESAGLYVHDRDYHVEEGEHCGPMTPELATYLNAVADEFVDRIDRGEPARAAPPRPGLAQRALTRWVRRHVDPQGLRRRRRPHVVQRLVDALQWETRPIALASLFRALVRESSPGPVPGLTPIHEIDSYDIIHFTGVHSTRLLYFCWPSAFPSHAIGWDVDVLKRMGKKIVYTNIGCLDGVSQTSFRKWGPHTVCDICRWRDEPTVCSDDRNLRWGRLRNYLADYQITLGGNRVDCNDDPACHEVPEFCCLDEDMWHPDLVVPTPHRLNMPPETVKIYHGVGDYDRRTKGGLRENIKTTHIIVPLVEQLKAEGYPVELVFCTDVPNKVVRYYQVQSDIFVDMLTYGFFGANVREALMLGKPAVCYLRPEWLETMRREIPEFVDELPVISATPETVHDVIVDLVTDPERRREIGRRSRAFALKWHSRAAAARRLAQVYSDLLYGEAPPPARSQDAPRQPGTPASSRRRSTSPA
ncbi:MAG: glycosyltransferase [Planctomycetes bacterium]|nr:glycosyltransferase [Planctomycetota bacterium]